MSVSVSVNGTSYTIPQTSETNWGSQVTAWIQAVSSSTLQKNGGTFTLTAELSFGATYGIKVAYLKSQGSNLSSAGIIRLANTESVGWRNAANGADLLLKPNVGTDGVLTYDSVDLVGTSLTQTLTNKTLTSCTLDASLNTVSKIVNANIDSAAAIAYSKLALTGGIVNADINASAAIAYSKLSLTGGIVNADINASAAIAYSKLSLTGSIVNADISTVDAAKITTGTLPLARGGTNATTKAGAFDSLSPMTTSGDIIYGGASGTGTRLAKGADGLFLSLASGIPSWASAPGGTSATAAKTANYTLTSSDTTIRGDASGGSFTLTLPAAASNSGKQFQFIRTDQTLANAITVDGNASETINGALTTKLMTQYESLTIESDGTNWIILTRRIPSGWVTYTPTHTGFGTPSSVQYQWRRVGDSIQIQGKFTSGTSTGVEARASLPSGLTTADSTRIPSLMLVGPGDIDVSTATYYIVTAEISKTYHTFGQQTASVSGLAKVNGNILLASGQAFSYQCTIPIADWEG